MFNSKVENYLLDLGFVPESIYKNISNRFKSSENIFEKLIMNFMNVKNLNSKKFNEFIGHYQLDDNSELYNVLRAVFIDIENYENGGRFELFKNHQAEWGVPSNVLNREDIGDIGDLSDLSDSFEIYRGMSHEEFISGDFGQSWSIDYEIARRFAEDTYSDKPKGIVAKTIISKHEVLHYDKNKEFEVIVIKGSPRKSNVSIDRR